MQIYAISSVYVYFTTSTLKHTFPSNIDNYGNDVRII